MPSTLLIGNPDCSWREWLREHRGSRDFLCLDPADPAQGLPGRLCLFRGGRPVFARFFGSLDPQRYPHLILAALAEGIRQAEGELLVQSFAYRPSPMMRHLTVLAAQMLQPETIMVAAHTPLNLNGFPVGPTVVEVEKSFPKVVQDAQRKAQWMKLIEESTQHSVSLDSITVEGARLGAGTTLDVAARARIGLEDAAHVEFCGNSLFVVADSEIDETQVSRALDLTHTTRATFARADAYDNLFCSFTRQSGEDFGFGLVQGINWQNGQIVVLNDAVPPAPVRMLRLGAIRVDPKGRELEEARPWQV